MSTTPTFSSMQEFETYKNDKIKELTIKFVAEYNATVKRYNDMIGLFNYPLCQIALKSIESTHFTWN